MPGMVSGITPYVPGTASLGTTQLQNPAPPPPAAHPPAAATNVTPYPTQSVPVPTGGGTPQISFPAPPTLSSPSAPPSFSNTAQQDPNLKRQLTRIDARLDNPEGSTRRAMDVATSNIRDANEGRRNAVQGMLAKRGVLSKSSVPELAEASMMDDEARQVNKASTDIALGREAANDQVLLGATGAYTASGEAQRAAQSLGNQQWQMADQARQQRDRAALDSWMGQIGMITQLAGLNF